MNLLMNVLVRCAVSTGVIHALYGTTREWDDVGGPVGEASMTLKGIATSQNTGSLSVCYRYAIMLEEAAEWELRQLDYSTSTGIMARDWEARQAWHDDSIASPNDRENRGERPAARPVRALQSGIADYWESCIAFFYMGPFSRDNGHGRERS